MSRGIGIGKCPRRLSPRRRIKGAYSAISLAVSPKIRVPSRSCPSVGVEKLMRKLWQRSLSSVRNAVPGSTQVLRSAARFTKSSMSTPSGRVHQAKSPPSKGLQLISGWKCSRMASTNTPALRR